MARISSRVGRSTVRSCTSPAAAAATAAVAPLPPAGRLSSYKGNYENRSDVQTPPGGWGPAASAGGGTERLSGWDAGHGSRRAPEARGVPRAPPGGPAGGGAEQLPRGRAAGRPAARLTRLRRLTSGRSGPRPAAQPVLSLAPRHCAEEATVDGDAEDAPR